MAELDAETLQQAREGHPRARETFLRCYVKLVAGLVHGSGVPNAKDVTQDVLVELLESLASYQPRPNVPTHSWVASATHHHLVDVRRKRHLTLVPLEDASEVPGSSPAPDAALHAHAERAELAAALEALPDIHRRAIVMASVQGHSLEHVAEAEGVPLGTIKSRLTNARRHLRRLMTGAEAGGRIERAAQG